MARNTAGGDFHPALRADVLLMREAPLSRKSSPFSMISNRLREKAPCERSFLMGRKNLIFRRMEAKAEVPALVVF